MERNAIILLRCTVLTVINQLEAMLKRPNFAEKCEHWSNRNISNGIYSDIYDGKVWNDFLTFKGKDFLKMPRSLTFGLNVDWFQPYSRWSDVSVGVIYLVILNLPREERFKWENVILVGVIPDMEPLTKPLTMPKSINPFLKPLVVELQVLWKGIRLHSSLSSIPLLFPGAILLAASDIPAARKLCGFKGHSAERVAPNASKASLYLLRLAKIFQDLTETSGRHDVTTCINAMQIW